jgi:hypothetical protein
MANRATMLPKVLVVVCLAAVLALLARVLLEDGGGDGSVAVWISGARGTGTAHVIRVEGGLSVPLGDRRVHVALQAVGADYYLISAPADSWEDRHYRWQADCPVPRGQQSLPYGELKAVAFLTGVQGLPSRITVQQWEQYGFGPKSRPKMVRTVEWMHVFMVMNAPAQRQLLALAAVLSAEFVVLAILLVKWPLALVHVVTILLPVALGVVVPMAPGGYRGWVGACCVVILGGADLALLWGLLVHRRRCRRRMGVRP